MTPTKPQSTPRASEFAKHGGMRPPSFIGEMYHFLRQNKKWWMLPLIVLLLALGGLLFLTSTAVAPFIYTLF